MMEIFDIPEPEFVIAVTLPGEVTVHNADSIEGSTLTWNIDLLDEQESGSLSATADMSSGSSGGSNTGIIIGTAVGAAVALLVVRQRVSAKKLDVSEEKVRLKNHCAYFIETINSEDSNGKKLGFISQELGREINTMGSKANHSEIQKLVVQMKDSLEKIKEQVLNVL